MSTRNLSRKVEIRNASVVYNEKYGKLLVIGGDSILSEEEYLELNKNPSFIAGAEWGDRTVIEKVGEWLEGNLPYSSKPPYQVIEDLRKAMEE